MFGITACTSFSRCLMIGRSMALEVAVPLTLVLAQDAGMLFNGFLRPPALRRPVASAGADFGRLEL